MRPVKMFLLNDSSIENDLFWEPMLFNYYLIISCSRIGLSYRSEGKRATLHHYILLFYYYSLTHYSVFYFTIVQN